MSNTYRIPAYFTLINWLIAVILGSLFIPITIGALGSKDEMLFNEEYFKTFLAFGAISGILSIPAIVLLLISNIILNRRGVSKLKFLIIQNSVHLVVSILTFGYIVLTEGLSFRNMILPVAFTYFIAGTIAW